MFFPNTFFLLHKTSTIKTKDSDCLRRKNDFTSTNPPPSSNYFLKFQLFFPFWTLVFFLYEKKVKVDFRSWKTRMLAKGSSLVLSSIFTATRLSVSVSSKTATHEVKGVNWDMLTASVNKVCEVPSGLAL